MKKIAGLLAVIYLLFLFGCEQAPALQLSIPEHRERGVFERTPEEFIKTFNQKCGEAHLAEKEIGELKKSEAGIYTRYAYAFDERNKIVLDCDGEDQLSALFLVHTAAGNASEGGPTGLSDFGAFLSITIYAATGLKGDELQKVLAELGVTTAQAPQSGFYLETQREGVHFQIAVEEKHIIFAMAALSAE